MRLDWRVVPIQSWPTAPTSDRREAQFRTVRRQQSSTDPTHTWTRSDRGVDWNKTTDLLARELERLGARNILLQLQVTKRDCRNDGWIRADARPSAPGVILTFDSDYGPLSYPCDTYDDWKANVRAIALSLEALRAVDRHGVTKRGEQYQGFNRLPPEGGTGLRGLTVESAALVVVCMAGREDEADELGRKLTRDPQLFRNLYRDAARHAHPDAGGTDAAFQNLQAAKAVLEKHYGGA